MREILGGSNVGVLSKIGRLGDLWQCHFKPEHINSLPNAWMHTVKLTGRIQTEEGTEGALEVDSIAVLDTKNGTVPEEAVNSLFWEYFSLDELAAQQNITAVDDLHAIIALWSANDDPDALMSHILHERRERRKLGEDRGCITVEWQKGEKSGKAERKGMDQWEGQR